MNEVVIYVAKSKVRWPGLEWAQATGKKLLKSGLRERLDDDKFVPQIKKRADGKPYLDNSKLHFNISHSQQYVVCAIGEVELGVDIQYHKKNDTKLVAKRSMSVGEWQAYQEADNQAKFFYDLWAKKESYLKYTGEGIRRDMRLLTLDAYIQEIIIADNYSGALCCGENCGYQIQMIENM